LHIVKKRKNKQKNNKVMCRQNSYKCYTNENVTIIQTEAHHLEKCGFIGSVGVFYPLCSIYSNSSHVGQLSELSDII
jgi:hypothetical protein